MKWEKADSYTRHSHIERKIQQHVPLPQVLRDTADVEFLKIALGERRNGSEHDVSA